MVVSGGSQGVKGDKRDVQTSDAQRLFFLQNVYSPTLNGTTRVVHVLSYCPFRFLANTFIPIVFWVYPT